MFIIKNKIIKKKWQKDYSKRKEEEKLLPDEL